MHLATVLLHAAGSDSQVGPAQSDAIQRLQSVLAAMDAGSRPTSEQAATSSPRESSSTKRTVCLAELRLLRAMQLEINERTLEVSEENEFQDLARDQGRLAGLINAMLPPPDDSQPNAGEPSNPKSDSELDKALQEAGLPGFAQPDGPTISAPSADAETELRKKQPSANGDDLGAASSDQDIVARIEQSMRNVQQRLKRSDASPETQRLQQQVVTDLSELIDSCTQGETGQDPERPHKGGSGAQAGTSPGENPGKATSSSEGEHRPRPDETAAGQQEPIDSLLIQVWGQLPEQLQEQIQSPVHEQFLPQYEQLIIEYYKRLAEADDK